MKTRLVKVNGTRSAVVGHMINKSVSAVDVSRVMSVIGRAGGSVRSAAKAEAARRRAIAMWGPGGSREGSRKCKTVKGLNTPAQAIDDKRVNEG